MTAPLVRLDDTTFQDRTIRLEPLTDDFEAQLFRAGERGQRRRPLGDDPLPPCGVVGELVGQGQPAGEVEGGLHGLAHSGPALVGGQELDGDLVALPTEARLQGDDDLAQCGVGARCHPQLQRGGEQRADVEVDEQPHHGGGLDGPGQGGGAGPQLAHRLSPHVLDGRGHQLAPAGENGAAALPGRPRRVRRRRWW